MDVEEKLDKILDDITEMKVVQAENCITLKEHTRRSTASEARIGHVETLLTGHFKFLKGMLFTVVIISSVLGVVLTLVNIYTKLKGG